MIRLSGRGVFDLLATVIEIEQTDRREPAAPRLGHGGDGGGEGHGGLNARTTLSSRGVRRVRLRVPIAHVHDGRASGHGVQELGARFGTLPAVLLSYPGPRSFTGEDSAELVFPAGPAIVDRVLRVLIGAGAQAEETVVVGGRERSSGPAVRVRSAGPGEFSARAYLNGRLSLEQAEGIVALLGARTAMQHAEALSLMRGERGDRFRAWADEVATLLALVEAGIDFTDQEDVVPIAPDALRVRIETLAEAMRGLLGHSRGEASTDARPRVVLFGRPNAGKSTLFNALLGRERAVVSDVAGTTRDVLSETLKLDDGVSRVAARECVLSDLAGLELLDDQTDVTSCSSPGEFGAPQQHRAAATISHQAQEHARTALRQANVIVWCDPDGLFETDRDAGECLHALTTASGLDATARVIRVRTKADLPVVAGAAPAAALGVCALDGWNLGTLRRAIADAVSRPTDHTSSSAVDHAKAGPTHQDESREDLCVPRHALALARTEAALRSALERLGKQPREEYDVAASIADQRPISPRAWLTRPELVAGDLRAAMDALGELTGQVTPDDVIGRIFATFCVGK